METPLVSHEASDQRLARRLFFELNGSEPAMEIVKSNANESLVIISDDDEPQFPFGIPPPVEVKRARSRSPINREVTFENQQAITVSCAM